MDQGQGSGRSCRQSDGLVSERLGRVCALRACVSWKIDGRSRCVHDGAITPSFTASMTGIPQIPGMQAVALSGQSRCPGYEFPFRACRAHR